ncbi:MAG TPA: fucose-binding lectin II [Mycobacteriales bacterium]|nr:fucose-binding lectin II [Mycobacteriales bacterium]
MDSTVVYLPFNTTVMIRAFTNASFQQRVTLAPEQGNPIVFTGIGENDTPIGNTSMRTPAQGTNPRGYQVTVTIETNPGTGWQPSSVGQGGSSIMYYNLTLVVSEDYVDQDWNDAVVTFTWWIPPSTRTLPDFDLAAGPDRPGGERPARGHGQHDRHGAHHEHDRREGNG